MGRLIAVLALAGAAAFASHPGAGSRSHNAAAPATVAASAPAAVAPAATDPVFEMAERDLARRQAEVGLVGSAPLFGAEGLPKPTR
jgi:hypothetical protein